MERSPIGPLLCAAAMLAAGCGPSITVVRQAMPNPFLGGATFALVPLDYATLTIDGSPPQVWLAQSGRDGAALQHDLHDAQTVFLAGAASVAGRAIVGAGHRFVVHTSVGAWTRGYYNWVTNPATTVSLNVRITTRRGEVLDEIWLSCRAGHTLFRPTPVQGLRVAMQECGEQLGGYLNQRRVSLIRRAHALASVRAAPEG